MQSALRDDPGLIVHLRDRQRRLIAHTLGAAHLGDLVDDLAHGFTTQDLLAAIPRELCRRLGFRRGWLWCLNEGDLLLFCQWPGHARPRRPSQSDRRALKGAAALAPSPTPKSLSIPLRSWTGDVYSVVHLEGPVPDHTLDDDSLALADRYAEVASAAFHKAELAQLLDETRHLLDSKTLALRESHHRIKNNLQALAGLLAATGVRGHSRAVREALGESVNRVMAIASIHDTLMAEQDDAIDLPALVDRLLRCVFPTFLDDGAPIRIHVDVGAKAYQHPSARATSLALVINELLTNSVKHAFPEGRGEITLALRCGRECVLTVADDGGTLPPGPLDESRFGLGLRIAQGIVCDELGGCFEITGGPRTVATARLPSLDSPGADACRSQPHSPSQHHSR